MEIVNISYTGFGSEIQRYSTRDLQLITNNNINNTFEDGVDTVEYFITDDSNFLLDYRYNAPYSLDPTSNIVGNRYSRVLIDPEADVKSMGYNRGVINIQYNFLKNLFGSDSVTSQYFIKEISNSRLELKLASQDLSSTSIVAGFDEFENYISQKNYYPDFYLNFGRNNLIIAVNAIVITESDGNSYLLIKLYEPLPIDIELKSQLSIVEKLGNSVSYKVDIQVESVAVDTSFKLRGPNYNVKDKQSIGQTTQYYSYNTLFSSNLTSSIRQLMSYYEDKALSINVDYSSFDNFIHFSSAEERVNNFVYKLGLIEDYNKQIYSQSLVVGTANQATVTSSVNLLNTYISNVIEKFDPYEYYLYYESESFAWPKSTSTKPYSLYSVTSSKAVSWLGSPTTTPNATTASVLFSASFYDSTNKDILRLSIPQYLRDDNSNGSYITFIDMIGQYFDNIWIYYKDITNRYNASNNPYEGISLDLVSDALKGFGIELYTNTNLSNDVYYSLFGTNNQNSLLPPTGSEKITTYVTSSISGSGRPYILPYDQVQKEVYKRIYHNLPYLLKTRGTQRGIKALIACYGIPNSVLTVNEFGGYNRNSVSGIDSINNDKISIVSQSSALYLSESILSSYTTIQKYNDLNRLSSYNLEIGFSPSDKINSNLSSSLANVFNIDQYIGDPKNLYSASYNSLDNYRNNYFSTYNYSHSIWEYIRLIKYYNNSLFKMVKDFVPARSNVSTGIVIKPHILERSKYARHEPEIAFANYSESIDIGTISAFAATSYSADTTVYQDVPSSIGYISVTQSFGVEKFTGEYMGTQVFATSLTSLGNQTEKSSNALTSSVVYLDTLINNVTASVRSTKYLDLDYSYNSIVPVNFGLITQSIDNSVSDNFNTYTNKNNPYAQLQDFNYFSQRSTIPRYFGSKLRGRKYNIYTTASFGYAGDESYGKFPVIDLRTQKLGLFSQVKTSPFFPGFSDVTMLYLVDRTSGINELNQSNNNWFEVQNTFKAGNTLTVKQFDNKNNFFDNEQASINAVHTIFESGYNYSPMLYFNAASDKRVYFSYLGTGNSYILARNNAIPDNFVSGSTSLRYPLIPSGSGMTSSIYNLFDVEVIDQSGAHFAGETASLDYTNYLVRNAGNYVINLRFDFNVTASNDAESGSFTMLIKKNGSIVGSRNYVFNSDGTAQGGNYPGNAYYITFGETYGSL